MEEFTLNEDIKVFCVKAESFPDKVLEAHQTLHSLIDFNPARKYFGLSNPDKNGTIIYKAAAEELIPGELSKHGLEAYTIPKGTYLSIFVSNFRNNVEEIGKAFQKLIAMDTIAPDGICIEWYLKNDDVRCMVKKRDH